MDILSSLHPNSYSKTNKIHQAHMDSKRMKINPLAWLAHQKYMIDQGMSATSQINAIASNALLIIVAEDKFKIWLHIKDMRILLVAGASCYALVMWMLGSFLYRTKFFEHYY